MPTPVSMSFGGLVRDGADLELGLGVEDGSVAEGEEPYLVERIGGVGNELAEEDFLVGLKGVDDE